MSCTKLSSEKQTKFCVNVNGFRAQRSCKEHVHTLHPVINKNKLSNISTLVCFINMQMVFDSVPRSLLCINFSHLQYKERSSWKQFNPCMIAWNAPSKLLSDFAMFQRRFGCVPSRTNQPNGMTILRLTYSCILTIQPWLPLTNTDYNECWMNLHHGARIRNSKSICQKPK